MEQRYISLPGTQELMDSPHVLVRALTAGWLAWCEPPSTRHLHAHKPASVLRPGWRMGYGVKPRRSNAKRKWRAGWSESKQ